MSAIDSSIAIENSADEITLSDFALVPISKLSNELFNFNSYNKKLESYTNEVADQIYNLEQISPALVKKILIENLYKTYKVEKVKKQQAPSTYILFFNDNYQEFASKNPLIKPKNVAKALGEQWKSLSEEEKAPYKQRVEDIKSQIADGTYNPPPKSRNKRRRTNSVSTTNMSQQQATESFESDNNDINTCNDSDVEDVVSNVDNKNKKMKVESSQ
jgi:hypothetical protein